MNNLYELFIRYPFLYGVSLFLILRTILRSSRPGVFRETGVFKNSTKFTGKCAGVSFNKVLAFSL